MNVVLRTRKSYVSAACNLVRRNMSAPGKFQFAIDRGGTFTDVYACCPGGKIRVMKLLSEDPSGLYPDAPTEGIRRILQEFHEGEREAYARGQPIPTGEIEWIRMGTTVATNALLERKGEKMALAVTSGFPDLLEIGNQSRPDIFDLEVKKASVLYEDVIEVEERVAMATAASLSAVVDHTGGDAKTKGMAKVKGSTGEDLVVLAPLNERKLRSDLIRLKEKGINSLAVALMHSYAVSDHEQKVGRIASEIGFGHVSISSEVMPMVKIVPRGYTTATDAYLTPLIKKYLSGFAAGFQDRLKGVNVLFMQSDGGLTPMSSFRGSRSILSGPAGGVVGYAVTNETASPVIGFDMGGTSTDVSRFAGSYEHVFETTTAGVTIQTPQLDINTVAAGGGSILTIRSGMFAVGPESAGARPGPACYRRGGPLAVTDANVCLGRVLPEYFPHVFGKNDDMPLDKDASQKAFQKLKPDMPVEEVAMGFIRVANEAMCRPIRALTQGRGYDTSKHVLACFGGAGGQHACAIARALGIRTVFIHKYAGILSAYGMACADVVEEAQEPCAVAYTPSNFQELDQRLDSMRLKCTKALLKHGFSPDCISTEAFLHMRYQGTDCAIMVTADEKSAHVNTSHHGDFLASFLRRYQSEFGFTISGRDIMVDDVRVRGTGRTMVSQVPDVPSSDGTPHPEKTVHVYFENGYLDTAVHLLTNLKHGHEISGPSIIIDDLSTILVEPNCTANITSKGDIKISIGDAPCDSVGTKLDPIQLSIFSHRFMSIAEQMGRVLQRTSMSTNIKERLDFSCALFGPDGGLISNAPHIPVHLGAMQETVQYQMNHYSDHLLPGNVILCNHPVAGGSHLPDLTVITPVFVNSKSPIFYVANRGHHSDIGGITPGSMPPHSKSLSEEGACFKSFLLVQNGVFREEALIEALMSPKLVPGCAGARNVNDNVSDLRAQVAANQKGIGLVTELIEQYGLNVVHAYMSYIQQNAEIAVRDVLRHIGREALSRTGRSILKAQDYMDDGTCIAVAISIDTATGDAIIDFTGTGPEVLGNCNAPRAITVSAVIYVLRCLVGEDIPLNQGCLTPVSLVIPPNSILSPSESAAVVGGNVLTSQRVVDVLLHAFEACAASCGCMNNVTFGDASMGYYETVAGGSGAGPHWSGRSGTHTHMTNTRITDPEIMERRYPIVVSKFCINRGSGGEGQFRGGDGLIRELTFTKPLTLSVLTERRALSPYGMSGGSPGKRGLNLLKKIDGRLINLGGKASVPVDTGDCFQLFTPGGGGYGDPTLTGSKSSQPAAHVTLQRGSVYDYKQSQESA